MRYLSLFSGIEAASVACNGMGWIFESMDAQESGRGRVPVMDEEEGRDDD